MVPPDRQLAATFVSEGRLQDTLVRGNNALVSTKNTAVLPNIFQSARRNHFSSTLCRLFIMSIVIIDEPIPYLELEQHLSDLGHPQYVIRRATDGLLKMRLVFSSRGFRLPKKEEELDQVTIENRDMPVAEHLMRYVGVSLRYLQGMAFVTPLERQFRSIVEVPEALGDDLSTFHMRIRCASALYMQIRSDWHAQKRFIDSRKEDADRLVRLISRYGLAELLENIQLTCLAQLAAIGRRSPELTEGLDFEALFPSLSQEHS